MASKIKIRIAEDVWEIVRDADQTRVGLVYHAKDHFVAYSCSTETNTTFGTFAGAVDHLRKRAAA
jgi:hypothetical protein